MDAMDAMDTASQSPASKAVHNRPPVSKASFPMVQKVPTVQSMGPCLRSP